MIKAWITVVLLAVFFLCGYSLLPGFKNTQSEQSVQVQTENTLGNTPEAKPAAEIEATAPAPTVSKDYNTDSFPTEKRQNILPVQEEPAQTQAGPNQNNGSAVLPDNDENPNEEVVKGIVAKGDTFTKILAATGSQGVQDFIDAARKVFSMRAFRDGQPYVITTDTASGRLRRFEYEIDSRHRLLVEGLEQTIARVEAIEYDTKLVAIAATVTDNLFQTMTEIGESPQLALRLAELFGAEINFIRDLQEGDAFSMLVEKRYREGEYKNYGRILAAHFTNKGKTFEAYFFRDGDGPANYYNRKGENIRKSFLQAPLAFTRITSGFTNSRKHPILGYSRPHPGVDYAAPVGTPVKAVGEGTVIHKNWAGGYGNQVVIKHGMGFESMYSHLSGYARNLKQGQQVRQGQVIGFVGSTGLSTGPHLDFRLRQNGKFVNPATAVNPRGLPVSPGARTAFEKTVAQELALLQGEKPLTDYDVDSIVADTITAPVKNDNENEQDNKNKKSKKRSRR